MIGRTITSLAGWRASHAGSKASRAAASSSEQGKVATILPTDSLRRETKVMAESVRKHPEYYAVARPTETKLFWAVPVAVLVEACAALEKRGIDAQGLQVLAECPEPYRSRTGEERHRAILAANLALLVRSEIRLGESSQALAAVKAVKTNLAKPFARWRSPEKIIAPLFSLTVYPSDRVFALSRLLPQAYEVITKANAWQSQSPAQWSIDKVTDAFAKEICKKHDVEPFERELAATFRKDLREWLQP